MLQIYLIQLGSPPKTPPKIIGGVIFYLIHIIYISTYLSYTGPLNHLTIIHLIRLPLSEHVYLHYIPLFLPLLYLS